MSREPYEKPKVESIDLGNLVQETRSGLEAAAARLDHVKGRLEVMSIELGEAEADFALALAEFEESKKKLLKLQAVEQLQEEAGEQEPAGS